MAVRVRLGDVWASKARIGECPLIAVFLGWLGGTKLGRGDRDGHGSEGGAARVMNRYLVLCYGVSLSGCSWAYELRSV